MTQGSCSTQNALTAEPSGHFSGDFAVSPDGTQVLFTSSHGAKVSPPGPMSPPPVTDIYVVPADGSRPAMRVAGDPALYDGGPSFFAGGKQIVWTQFNVPAPTDMFPTWSALWIANADGTNAHALLAAASAKPGEAHLIQGSANIGVACALAGPAARGGAAVSALLFAVAVALSRRTRRG
jgi:hypothetical protein